MRRCHLLLGVPLVIVGFFVFRAWTTAFPIALAVAIGMAVIGYSSARPLRQPSLAGKEAMVGLAGEAVSELNPEGLVRARGELWVAGAPDAMSKGARVRIVEVRVAKMRTRPWGS